MIKYHSKYLSTIQSAPNPNTRLILGRNGKLPTKGRDGGPANMIYFKICIHIQKPGFQSYISILLLRFFKSLLPGGKLDGFLRNK